MPVFNSNDTAAILAFFGGSSGTKKKPSTTSVPRDEEYYTSTTPTTSSSKPKPTSSSSSSTRKPSTSTVPRDEAYYTSTTPTYKAPVKPPAPKVKRKPSTSSAPRDKEYYTSAPTSDPFLQAVNRWRDSNLNVQPQAQMGPRPKPQAPGPVFQGYNVTPSTVDFALNRPDTGVNAVQQSATIGGRTVGPPPQPAYNPLSSANTGQRRYGLQSPAQPNVAPPQTNLNAFYDDRGATSGATLADSPFQNPFDGWDERLQGWLQSMQVPDYGAQNRVMGDFADTVRNSAAVERAQFDIAQRNKEFSERERSTWRDLRESVGDAWDAMTGNNQLLRQEAGQWWSGDQPFTQALSDYWQGMNFAPAYSPYWTAADISRFTANTARQTQNLMSGLQAGQDLAYNYPYLPGNVPPSQYAAAFVDTIMNDPSRKKLEQVTPEMITRRWGEFWETFGKNFDAYTQAITPTLEQRLRLTPAELQKQQERAYLNTFGGSESVANTFDALVNQQQTVDQLNSDAQRLFLAGAAEVNEDVRQELWYQAAQKGYEAERLQSTHPVALVNENTNLLRQLGTEILLPDLTDLLGGLFSVVGATPKARRLTSTANEVLTSEQQAIKALQNMIVSPANQAAIMAERSTYKAGFDGWNNLWNLWSVGTARAQMAADKLVRYTVNLLSDVETPQDARLLLQQLATDPTKLLSGVKATMYQSPRLIARAGADGLIKFGNMNLQNLKEPLRIYQQAAQDLLNNSKTLQGGPVFDKLNFFLGEFIPSIQQQGYRFYNVADEMPNVPAGAKTTRLKAVQGGQYVVEYVDSAKKVISTSDPMLIQDARKLQDAFKGGQITAPQSFIGNIGGAMRKIVSGPYILLNPGTWATNVINGAAVAMGDGVWSTETAKAMDAWKTKLYGLDPTMRGLENMSGALPSAGMTANATFSGGNIPVVGPVMRWLREKYGAIDENAGRRVFHASVQHALRKVGKPLLQQTLTPILQEMGITNARQIKRITNHLFEVAYSGGNMAEEWARVMTNNARVFSLSDVNPQWLGAIPETALEDFYTVIRTATNRDDAIAKLTTWREKAAKYWDDLIAAAPPTPQRHVWMRQEVAQDTADLAQAGKNATKYGNIPQETVQAFVQQTATALQDIKRKQDTLLQLVADAQDPANRYALYNVWGQVTDLTANVRAQLLELAENAGSTPPGAARQAAWGEYWTEAQRLWTERNQAVSNLLEQSATAIASGQKFNPQFDVWQTLERTAQANEQKLWDALRLEPQSGAYDARLKTVIDAGRQIADKSMARVYAAARRFTNVDAMDYIVSAEHNVQIAGAKARAYLDKVLDQVTNSKNPNWERYYSIRNETWRQLRQYERDIWALAERNIVRDGLANEATSGLRFDAGPDGTVELIRPENVVTQKTSKLGKEKSVTTENKAYWTVKREDGTITRVPDSMVPQDLKDRYNGLTPDEIESQVQVELDNIASAEPFAPDAQRVIDGPDIDTAPNPYAETEVLEPELQRLLDEPAQTPPITQVQPAKPGVRGYLGDQQVTILGKGDGDSYRYRLADGTEGNAPTEQLFIVGRNGERRSLANVATLRGSQETVARAGAASQGLQQTLDTLRTEWDRVAKGEKGYLKLENAARIYVKNGVAQVPENKFEDLYGLTIAGQRIENQEDVNRFLQEYYNLRQQVARAKRQQQTARATYQEAWNVAQQAAETATTVTRSMIADLRRLAAQANIASANEGGMPINKWLVNVIKKDLGIDIERLEDLTPAQFDEAVDALEARRVAAQQAGQAAEGGERALEFTVPRFDYDAWARKNVGKGLDLSPGLKRAEATTKATTAAGGAVAPDLGLGAAFAKQQLDNIYNHVVQNIDEILTPATGFSQGQTLRALDEFKRKVLPAWDNAKYIASEYGNRMRSFTLVDFANNTRLDELLGLVMPYGFWATRTMKNSLERAIFEPHIWRRVVQTEMGINRIQEQRGDPLRYRGSIPIDMPVVEAYLNDMGIEVDLGEGTIYLRLLPSKYWQAAGLFTSNDYADPESANGALGFAIESMRASNLNPYPWIDIASKYWQGKGDDVYVPNYTPQGRIFSNLAIMLFGADAARRFQLPGEVGSVAMMPGFFENSVARELNNMSAKGDITKIQAKAAHELLWQLKNGGQPLPEQATLFDMEELTAILDKAMRAAAGKDMVGALSSWATGVNVKPYDEAEKIWTDAQQEYYNNQYGPHNPYGSNLASDATQDMASLAWSKSAIWKPEESRPGVQLVTDMKKQEKEAVNQDLMTATDNWIQAQKETPTNKEINDFKAEYIIKKFGDQGIEPEGDYKYPFFVDVINAYLDNRYPSAQEFDGGDGPRYEGYAPEEVRERVRTSAYYQALEDLEDQKPVSPGSGKSWQVYQAYSQAKADYEKALEARVTELINDPQWLAAQTGTPFRITRTGESEGTYRLQPMTLDNAFGVPQRPTGDPQDPYMTGLVDLAGSPQDAAAIIQQEKTKYMGPVEQKAREENDAKGDRSGRRYYSRSRGRRYYSRRGGGGRRRYYGGGGGGSGGGFAYTDMPEARGLNSSLWNSGDDIRPWRPWNNTAQDWLYAGQRIGPDKLEDWKPIKV